MSIQSDLLQTIENITLERFQHSWNSGELSEQGTCDFVRGSSTFQGSHALHLVSYFGHFEVLKWLEEIKYPIDQTDNEGRNALHYILLSPICRENSDTTNLESCFHLLIKTKGLINQKDGKGNTPLHYATESNTTNFAKELIVAGATLLPNSEGLTPFDLVKKKKEQSSDAAELCTIFSDLGTYLEFLVPEDLPLNNEIRFSLSTAQLMASLCKVGDLINDGKNNESIRLILNRWRFFNHKIVILDASKQSALVAFGHGIQVVVFFDYNPSPMDFKGVNTNDFQRLWKLTSAHLLLSGENGPRDPIYVTGHGLSGALAIQAVYDLHSQNFPSNQLHLYTFGQPRTGLSSFRQAFDTKIQQAYAVIHEGDPLPEIQPNPRGVEESFHCGSLRLITAHGQLYNDKHYQFHDVRRRFYDPEFLKTRLHILERFRRQWTQGLIGIREQEEREPILPLETPVTLESPRFIGDLDNYLRRLTELSKQVKLPLDKGETNTVIAKTDQIFAPKDLWDPRIKGVRYQRERNEAFLLWIGHYCQDLPKPYSYNLVVSKEILLQWFEQESEVLSYIQSQLNGLNVRFQESSLVPPPPLEDITLSSNRVVSPLIETGFQQWIHMVGHLRSGEALNLHKQFYFGLPNTGYFFKSSDSDSSMTKFSLEKRQFLSPYREHFLELFRNDPSPIFSTLERYPYHDGTRPTLAPEFQQWEKDVSKLFKDLKSPSSALENQPNDGRLYAIVNQKIIGGTLRPDVLEQIIAARKDAETLRKAAAKNKRSDEVIFGRRLVWSIQVDGVSFHVKEFPELPGLERASFLLSRRILGEGIPSNCLGRLTVPAMNDGSSDKARKRTSKATSSSKNSSMEVIPVMISRTVSGENFQLKIQNPCVMMNIHPGRYSQLFLLNLLTLVEDGKPDNFILTLSDDDQWLLNAIDNDHVFVPPFVGNKLNMKSILFCMENMKKKIDPSVVEQFLLLDLEETLLRWLEDLHQEDLLVIDTPGEHGGIFTLDEAKEFLMYKGISGEKSPVILRCLFEKEMIYEMYTRMRVVQNYLRNEFSLSALPTHAQILEHTIPQVYAKYQKKLDKADQTPWKRFVRLTSSQYSTTKSGAMVTKQNSTQLISDQLGVKVLKVSPLSNENAPSAQIEALSSWIRACEGDVTKFQPLFSALDSLNKSEFLFHLKALGLPLREFFFHRHLPRRLESVQKPETRARLQKIVISSVRVFQDWTKLDLSGMEYLDDASLDQILKRNPLLEALYLQNTLGITQIGLSRNNFLMLPRLYKLDIRGSEFIRQIHLNIPKIRSIYLDPLPSIAQSIRVLHKPGSQEIRCNAIVLGDYLNNAKVKLWKAFSSLEGNQSDLNSPLVIRSGFCDHQVVFQSHLDISGQENDARLASYNEVDVFLVIFSVVDGSSFREISNKWADVLRYFPEKPLLICGVDVNQRLTCRNAITTAQGIELARDVSASLYLECSFDDLKSIREVFEAFVAFGLHQRSSGQSIMSAVSPALVTHFQTRVGKHRSSYLAPFIPVPSSSSS